MGLWRLENSIIEAIAFHHLPARSMSQNIGLLAAVHVGDALDYEARISSGENTQLQCDTEYLNKLEITRRIPQWRQACSELRERNG